MSSSKMCSNCFESVSEKDPKCGNCSLELYTNNKTENAIDSYSRGRYIEPDYDTEINKIEDLKKSSEERFKTKSKENDIKIVAILISIIGLLQIYTGSIVDSINESAEFVGADQIIEGKYFVYSGFLYFFGILLFFINYQAARIVYVISNLIHVYILYTSYQGLFYVYDILKIIGQSNLPPDVQNFMDSVGLFRVFIILFGIFYVGQSIFLFRYELSRYVYRE